jgi:hypothetical protein
MVYEVFDAGGRTMVDVPAFSLQKRKRTTSLIDLEEA